MMSKVMSKALSPFGEKWKNEVGSGLRRILLEGDVDTCAVLHALSLTVNNQNSAPSGPCEIFLQQNRGVYYSIV